MAKHSESSFNESEAIRILSEYLESTNRIKTFFKENDRTPNYDGCFELVTRNGEPKKQFIVQIKKTKSLNRCETGKNAGKYIYPLHTAFLYYVKAKVTESPAIYFVVDIESNHIFYIYLSDDKLMSLNFEGKEHVTYAFSEDEILTDIDSFYVKLLKISDLRNKRLLYKSPKEIAELQEAADYINTLFNGDLKIIKDYSFPGLWRFGVGYTPDAQLEISYKNSDGERIVTSSSSSTSLFGLYPQFKGVTGTEIGEYQWNNFGSIIDCNGQAKPIDYVKRSIHKTIQRFCQNPPAKLLPDVVLGERIYKKASFLSELFTPGSSKLTVDDLVNKLYCVLSYFDYLFFSSQNETEGEKQFKRMANNLLQQRLNSVDFFNPFFMNCISDELKAYFYKTKEYRFNPKRVLRIITLSDIHFLTDLLELSSRKVKTINSEWIDSNNILFGNDIQSINDLYSDYFARLPNLYYEFYRNVFSKNNEYRFNCKVDYYLYIDERPYRRQKFCARINKYSQFDDEIVINNVLITEDGFTDLEKRSGVTEKIITCSFNPQGANQQLFYDGVRCWLYQGICNKLGLKIEGLDLGNLSHDTIF